jgi:ankyrin repeat protein
MWAAAKGKADNVAFLLKKGAQVNAVTAKGFTPLFFAIRSKDPKAAALLLDAGADTKAVLPSGATLIRAAFAANNIPAAMQIVAHGADINQRDGEGRQLIHLAALSGGADLVKLVLSKGADPNAMTKPPPHKTAPPMPAANGAAPPLIFAAMAGSLDTMKALIAAGAKPDLNGEDGTTLALAAAYGGNLAALKYALELQPDVNVRGPGGVTLIHMAVMNPHPPEPEAVITYLAEKGAKLNVRARTEPSFPPDRIYTAADYVNRSVSERLRVFFIDFIRQRGVQ